MMCGTALGAAPTPQAEERKVVSVLFVDLVGFTARSHDADPEDVRAALAPYHRLLKTEIERFGGTVEKFIGDAVMAVFGAPVAHEDDAERAVRAALRITEAIEELNEATPNLDLSIRAAVNTGEGLVSIGARPQAGEGMVTGDVVNTASRLQGIAPVGGVAVGEITYRSTKDLIVYEEMEPVSVKGKPEPLLVWRAVSARSRFGVDVETRYRTPFIGRDFDLATLKTAYQRTLRESSLQMVTVVGEPGVGKSRLLGEFASYVDEQSELVTWRQGRSLPYGEGITFWALGEIVKAQAGINESDSPDVATNKIAAAVGALAVDESDTAWLQARLAPLVGATTIMGGAAEKEESFTAWVRFLEAIATKGPLVLVFEDLHWADASLLEFIEHVVEWSTGVPLLIVCTARPELFEKQPSWGAGTRNAATISLSPLTDSETAQLISGLLSQAVLPAEIHAALLERAGGNPLYAEEFIRMLSDRGVLQQRGRVLTIDTEADIPLPDNVQALIAARLDTLPAERKSLLYNAAVVGKVFWSGAVAAIAEIDDGVVKAGLHELVRKELVRPARVSSMEGQQEYSFWHALVRDVCYGQIPRAVRGRKHEAMAGWVERMAGERVADQAEVLAHHYSEALSLASASGAEDDKGRLLAPTKRFASLAGDRAANLDAPRAVSYYEAALALMLPDDPARGRTLLNSGRILEALGDFAKAETHLREAIEHLSRFAGPVEQADAILTLCPLLGNQGRVEDAKRLLDDARVLLERHGPSPELARTYSVLAVFHNREGAFKDGLMWSNKAISVARGVGAEDLEAVALSSRGEARCGLGDSGGLQDLRIGAARSEELNAHPRGVSVNYVNLGDWAWLFEGPKEGLEAKRHAFDFSSRRGMAGDAMWAKAESLAMLFDMGEWDQLLSEADEVLGWSRSQEASSVEIRALSYKCFVLAFRDHVKEALAGEERLRLILNQGVDSWGMFQALAIAASIRNAAGDGSEAVRLVTQFAEATEGMPSRRALFLPSVMRVLAAGEEPRLAERIMIEEADVGAIRDKNSALTAKAILLEAQGRSEQARDLYHEAAQSWAGFGFVLEEGQAHLGLARCLIALGDRDSATDPLHKARAIFERLGAVPLINETDSNLQAEAAS